MLSGEESSIGWLKAFEAIQHAASHDDEWRNCLGRPGAEMPKCGIHLAVFVEPFLGYVLDGSKSVESRFSVNRCAPYGRVHRGDVLLLKRAGGGVVGIARVVTVWFYHLDEASWSMIRETFSAALRAQDPDFWEKRRNATCATLMRIDRVLAFKPIRWEKRDRRGWVVLQASEEESLFRGDHE